MPALLQPPPHPCCAPRPPTHCRVSIVGLKSFAPGNPLTLRGKRVDGSTYEFPVNHTFNDNQINWFKHGSALNAMAALFKSQKKA